MCYFSFTLDEKRFTNHTNVNYLGTEVPLELGYGTMISFHFHIYKEDNEKGRQICLSTTHTNDHS
jgi:hypothetical protein